MTVAPRVFDSAADLGAEAARQVATGIEEASARGRRFLLGCPGGRSARSTYVALGALVAEQALDLGSVVIVMMDDYLVPGPDGRLVHEDPNALHSCIRFARDEIVTVLNAGASPGRGISAAHLWFPDPAEPSRYDEQIEAAGGVDLFLLASGAGDGHVAFNGPGTDRRTRTRVVPLPDSTRTDNLATFPSFGGQLDRVPRDGVTVGIATIRDLSQRVIMLLHGADKGKAAARLTAAEHYEEDWPATVFTECTSAQLFLDSAAARAAGLPS